MDFAITKLKHHLGTCLRVHTFSLLMYEKIALINVILDNVDGTVRYGFTVCRDSVLALQIQA